MRWFGMVLALLAAVGCGSGGGPTGGPPTAGGDDLSSVPQERLVVQMDYNNDNEPDVLTLDTSRTPFEVVEAIEGTPGGDPVDMTGVLKGQPIDAQVSAALVEYLAGSFGVATRTELDCRDQAGERITVVVFE